MYLGIDQSYSHTGVVLLDDEGNIKNVFSIIPSNDVTKFYPNQFLDVTNCSAFKHGLITEIGQVTKKKKDFTKDETQLLKVSYQDRFKFITCTLSEILAQLPSDTKVGIENISLFSKGAVVDLARLLGAIEHTLQTFHLEHSLFPPTVVKKFAGKGNAGKDEMISYVPITDLAILKMYCPKDKNDQCVGLDNLVDAYWIAKLTRSAY
jgi:Holliday junction resolvasome RuvABC endonuclease subunit